ncbi:MAG: hypothetical protein DMG13_23155 [Acidobacteria bacterium]|nr:MAG: hypothetical protein DMG13_23155 [Acidobacteriota bacterium]
MKYASVRVFSVVAALAAALLGSPIVVRAQSHEMGVKVPFEFYIGDQKFPAGHYMVWRNQGSLVYLSDGNGHNSVIFASPITRRSSNQLGYLVFNRFGNSHFLSEVRWTDSDTAMQFSKSSGERALAKNIGPEQVVTRNTNR